MPRNRKQIDDENPEWTKEDFARARPITEVLSPGALRSFKQYRGPQKAPKKVAVSIRLNPVVVAHFKATGEGWQARIDQALTKIVERNAKTQPKKARPTAKKGKAA